MKIFQGVGADTRGIVFALLIFWGVRFMVGVGAIVFTITFIVRKIMSVVESCGQANTSLVRQMRNDLDLPAGEITHDEREQILLAWQRRNK